MIGVNLKIQRRQWSRVIFLVLTLMYFLSLAGTGFAVFAYNKYLGNSSPVQAWLNENATSYSADLFDVLVLTQDVSIAVSHALVNKTSENTRATLKEKVELLEGVLAGFDLNTEVGELVRTYRSANNSFQTTHEFLRAVNAWMANPQTMSDVTIAEYGNAALLAMRRLANEAVQREFEARDEMVVTINSSRMLAERAAYIGIALFIFGLFALISVYWAFKKWMIAERERFDRFEYLLSAVGHDLRSPLQAIVSCAGLLRKSTTAPNNQEYVNIIKDSSQQLARLVDDLVGLARNEELSFEPHPLNLNTWLQKITARFTIDAERKGLRFEVVCNANTLPTITFDETRLTQCIGNLVSNAIRYTDSGTIKLTLSHTQQSAEKGVLLLDVEDTGAGIADTDRTRIFMPFERASSKPDGKGLGLAIVSSIVRTVHGKVSLQSTVGVGSTFSVTLPISYAKALDSDAVQQANIETLNLKTNKAQKACTHILIVDDDPSLRTAFAGIVADMGYTSDQASDGEEGFKLAMNTAYHAIITDIQMPGWDGFQFAQRCREKLNPCPLLIAITAYTKTLRGDSRANLFDKIVYKPIDDDLLLAVLDQERTPCPAS